MLSVGGIHRAALGVWRMKRTTTSRLGSSPSPDAARPAPQNQDRRRRRSARKQFHRTTRQARNTPEPCDNSLSKLQGKRRCRYQNYRRSRARSLPKAAAPSSPPMNLEDDLCSLLRSRQHHHRAHPRRAVSSGDSRGSTTTRPRPAPARSIYRLPSNDRATPRWQPMTVAPHGRCTADKSASSFALIG